MLPKIGNDVRVWPAPLQDLHRNGHFRSFSERSAAVDMERRRIDARAVMQYLTEHGWCRVGSPSLDGLAEAVDCDTAQTVRWEIAETLDKCAGTKARIIDQIRSGEDCSTCPPGFLAVVVQAEKLAKALGIALDLLGVEPLPADAELET
jgi:hypothetical protein